MACTKDAHPGIRQTDFNISGSRGPGNQSPGSTYPCENDSGLVYCHTYIVGFRERLIAVLTEFPGLCDLRLLRKHASPLLYFVQCGQRALPH